MQYSFANGCKALNSISCESLDAFFFANPIYNLENFMMNCLVSGGEEVMRSMKIESSSYKVCPKS
jgi:hypothetical protein